MAGIIRTLFRSKKSKKEDVENNEDLAREVSNRRSFRAPSSSFKSQRRVARFADDGALPATAAYHTTTAPKLRKGPQSCPGGYRDESDVSYESDKYSQKSSSHRRRDVLHQSMRQNYAIDEGRASSSGGRRHHSSNKSDFRRRGESSEYGSGDPSPVGQYSSRYSHYEDPIEESENDDFTEKAQFAVIERASQHYRQKYKESEQKRREEKRKLKEIEKECDEVKDNIFKCMNQLEKVKKERDCFRKELSRCKKQLEIFQNQNKGIDAYHHLHQPQLSNPQQYPPPRSAYYIQPMNGSHHMQTSFSSAPPSSNTPMTMTSSGAGESLTNPSDVSFLHGGLQNSFLQSSSHVLSRMTPSPGFKVPTNFNDDDTDEVKDYRSGGLLSIETARNNKDIDDGSISPSSSADSQVTLLEHSTTIISNKENRKPPTRPFSKMSI